MVQFERSPEDTSNWFQVQGAEMEEVNKSSIADAARLSPFRVHEDKRDAEK